MLSRLPWKRAYLYQVPMKGAAQLGLWDEILPFGRLDKPVAAIAYIKDAFWKGFRTSTRMSPASTQSAHYKD